MGTNKFDRYSSKVKRVNIPLPSFNYVHKSWISNRRGTQGVGYLIGRDRIIEKLKTWLTKEKTDGGSYLITGYRGMGKTSFVDSVIYELVGEPSFWDNLIGTISFIVVILCAVLWRAGYSQTALWCTCVGVPAAILMLFYTCKRFLFFEMCKKSMFRLKAGLRYIIRHKICNLGGMINVMYKTWNQLTPKEWGRINHHIYSTDVRKKRYSHICVNINLGQEILDERSILCVLTSQLHNKYFRYIMSPIANVEMWCLYVSVIAVGIIYVPSYVTLLRIYVGNPFCNLCTPTVCLIAYVFVVLFILMVMTWHQIHALSLLRILSKRINATLIEEGRLQILDTNVRLGLRHQLNYPIASTRDIESQLITILDRIDRFPIHPTFYFVFDELDKIETPVQSREESMPEFTSEKYLETGGTSRKRKFSVMHLLANMKFFTSTAKAKFIFIAGREMYDGYLADLTDRESAISSLFNGVIYVESFCKNEKSERDVMYNAETFISRQLLPKQYIMDRVIDKYIECKLNGTDYVNIDVNLKMYYEYLVNVYADKIQREKGTISENKPLMDDARACIDKAIGLLYHYSVYLYHLSNGSPKKMRMAFESLIRPLKNPDEFKLTNDKQFCPLDNQDLDVHLPETCRYLLSFGEREQRIIGFVHYISFPVSQIISASDQFGDKLLVSASFLINHLYKHHSGGFSWRNIEQIPELLNVYRIPEFREFINSILSFLLQTHIIQIPCGLYQYKFRMQIAEEISLASQVSEEVSALFNFTLDESQAVKQHYRELQRKHLALLKEEKVYSPHSVAGIHHILGDMYLEDEEYNNAIFEYQTALRVLERMNTGNAEKSNDNPHKATLMLAYIRNMLKLGMTFEKRRTYGSAYNTYNEIISRLFAFREFDESKEKFICEEQPKVDWPYEDIILYKKDEDNDKQDKEIMVHSNQEMNKHRSYQTKSNWIIADFAHRLSPERHTVLQRLGMLEDTRIVYQALLAKLFVNEKVELGGITRTNLDVIEGEFRYIHMMTNEKQKFLISTDFFRRLGDIMFYKNGLIGFNYTQTHAESANSPLETCAGKHLYEAFVDGLYFWGFNINAELSQFCQEKKCHELYGALLKEVRRLRYEDFTAMQEGHYHHVVITTSSDVSMDILQSTFNKFWQQEVILKRIQKLPLKEIKHCNDRRQKMWANNKTLPCYACMYYNRSLGIIMHNLFNMDMSEKRQENKIIAMLRQIVIGGSAKSMRQNYMIQLGEVLDCLGNTILSCSCVSTKATDNNDGSMSSVSDGGLTGEFLAKFLHDVHEINGNLDAIKYERNFKLLLSPSIRFTKLETAIVYFWEASVCFRYGRDLKKAAGSMKKILRVIQNYLRVNEVLLKNKPTLLVDCKILIGEFLNEIKNRIVKQCLICLYSHYNFFNLVEIQRLKWIFYVQMYENISLSRLSLFPDVEEIMLIYYELIKLCIVDKKYIDYEHTNRVMKDVRTYIMDFSRAKDELTNKDFTWDDIQSRNKDFTKRLVGIYHHMSMGCLRHDNTMYEKVLSLRSKMQLNKHILSMAFPDLSEPKCYQDYVKIFCMIFTTGSYECKGYNEQWRLFFPNIGSNNNRQQPSDIIIEKMHLLEFLIRDSIYCLTTILEGITPQLSTTLFTNSFMGGIYQSLNQWNIMFDALYGYYKFFDEGWEGDLDCPTDGVVRELFFSDYDSLSREVTEKCSECEKEQECFDSNSRTHTYFESLGLTDKGQSYEKVMRLKWPSRCPHYDQFTCKHKRNEYEKGREFITEWLNDPGVKYDKDTLRKIYRQASHQRNTADAFFQSVLDAIKKPNIQYTLTNYSGEMALKSYRMAKELHREGKTYKEMISNMYFLDDDLKNDTIQFDIAIERFKINSGFIDMNIELVMEFFTLSIYDIECFCTDNETRLPLENRFQDLFWNVNQDKESLLGTV